MFRVVLEDFEELDRAFRKSQKVIENEGFPRFLVRCLVDLEDFVSEIWEDKEARKKMSKLNSKGDVTQSPRFTLYENKFAHTPYHSLMTLHRPPRFTLYKNTFAITPYQPLNDPLC